MSKQSAMKLIIAIIALMWIYSMFKFHRKMKYFNSIMKYYEIKRSTNPDDVMTLMGLASAYMQAQKYQKAYCIYQQLCAKGVDRAAGYRVAILTNMQFCEHPVPGSKGPKDYNKSWLHNFILVRLGGRRQYHFTEDDILNAESLMRQGII